MIAPNKFTQYVHGLEDKYATSKSNSITNVPDAEMKKFFDFSKRYYSHCEKEKMSDGERMIHTKKYRQLLNEFFERVQTNELTTLELEHLMNENDALTNHGHYLYSQHTVYHMLRNRGLKWRKSKADPRTEQGVTK